MLIELRHRQTRVEDVRDHDRAVEPLHHPAQHRRFAGADFAGHDDQAFAALDAVVKVGHHFSVRRREIDEARIRGQREWQLVQSVKLGVHDFLRGYARVPRASTPEACVPNYIVRNLSNTCVMRKTKASIGVATNAIAIPAVIKAIRLRGIATASAGVSRTGIEASTGSPV